MEIFTLLLEPGPTPNDLTTLVYLALLDTITMAGPISKKRHFDSKRLAPSKKRKKQKEYHSDSDDAAEGEDFKAVNLLDSDDEDLHNVQADDYSASEQGDSDSEVESNSKLNDKRANMTANKRKSKTDKSAELKNAGSSDGSDVDNDNDDDNDEVEDEEESIDGSRRKKSTSKRNDPSAFATSLSKILNTKLSSTRRADPVLARSAAAHESAKAAVDTALEAKARKVIREQRRLASEKGRVRDVLIASHSGAPGEEEQTTGGILETERRLRKVAQRGVVKLFNAVRAAQVKASEAEKATRKEGVIGVVRREEKINEMSKKGFLDLIASGGGKLKKGPIEEA
jgi:hypothetical protein